MPIKKPTITSKDPSLRRTVDKIYDDINSISKKIEEPNTVRKAISSDKLKDVEIDDSAKASGKVLVYDSGSNKLKYAEQNYLPLAGGTMTGSIYFTETSAASGDTAGLGQLWVKDDDPANLYYTNDDGEDIQITYNDHIAPTEQTRIQVRNDEGITIPAGSPLYSKGEIGGSERILVGIADASDANKMPCIGISYEEMNTSSTQDNYAVVSGVYTTNITVTSVSEQDTMYVAPHGGTAPYLTITRPTATNHLIQNVGICIRQTATNVSAGTLVSAIGRTNDVPNLLTNTLHADDNVKIEFGDAGEYIKGDGTDLHIASSNDILFTGTDLDCNNMRILDINRIIFNAGGSVNNVLDEDDMASDSNLGVPTQQSVKAYVDSHQKFSESIEFYFDQEVTSRTYFRDADDSNYPFKWDTYDTENSTTVGDTISITSTNATGGVIVPYDCKLKGVRWVGYNGQNYNQIVDMQVWTGTVGNHSASLVTATLRDSRRVTNHNRESFNIGQALDVSLSAGDSVLPAFLYTSGTAVTFSGKVAFLFERA